MDSTASAAFREEVERRLDEARWMLEKEGWNPPARLRDGLTGRQWRALTVAQREQRLRAALAEQVLGEWTTLVTEPPRAALRVVVPCVYCGDLLPHDGPTHRPVRRWHEDCQPRGPRRKRRSDSDDVIVEPSHPTQ